MEEIKAYKSNSGEIFSTKEEALTADYTQNAVENYRDNIMLCYGALQLENFYEFKRWFLANKEWLLPALGVEESGNG